MLLCFADNFARLIVYKSRRPGQLKRTRSQDKSRDELGYSDDDHSDDDNGNVNLNAGDGGGQKRARAEEQAEPSGTSPADGAENEDCREIELSTSRGLKRLKSSPEIPPVRRPTGDVIPCDLTCTKLSRTP